MERVPEVRHVISRVGSDELGLDPMPLNESDVFLELAPRGEWRGPDTDWLVGEIRTVVADFIGIETSFTQPIEMRVSELLTGSRGDVAIKVFGPDSGKLAELAGQIETRPFLSAVIWIRQLRHMGSGKRNWSRQVENTCSSQISPWCSAPKVSRL